MSVKVILRREFNEVNIVGMTVFCDADIVIRLSHSGDESGALFLQKAPV